VRSRGGGAQRALHFLSAQPRGTAAGGVAGVAWRSASAKSRPVEFFAGPHGSASWRAVSCLYRRWGEPLPQAPPQFPQLPSLHSGELRHHRRQRERGRAAGARPPPVACRARPAGAAPIPRCVRPGPRHRIAHAALLRQGQGNAALVQVRGAAAPRQGGLECGERRRQVATRGGGRPRRQARRAGLHPHRP